MNLFLCAYEHLELKSIKFVRGESSMSQNRPKGANFYFTMVWDHYGANFILAFTDKLYVTSTLMNYLEPRLF